MEHGFAWVSIIPGLNLLPAHTATATLVIAALLVWSAVGLRQLRAARDPVVPDGTLTARHCPPCHQADRLGKDSQIRSPLKSVPVK